VGLLGRKLGAEDCPLLCCRTMSEGVLRGLQRSGARGRLLEVQRDTSADWVGTRSSDPVVGQPELVRAPLRSTSIIRLMNNAISKRPQT